MFTTGELIERIRGGHFDAAFASLYCADAQGVTKQRARYIAAVEAFAELYGSAREVAVYSAPGRTEIGGNHTDHNNGMLWQLR